MTSYSAPNPAQRRVCHYLAADLSYLLLPFPDALHLGYVFTVRQDNESCGEDRLLRCRPLSSPVGSCLSEQGRLLPGKFQFRRLTYPQVLRAERVR